MSDFAQRPLRLAGLLYGAVFSAPADQLGDQNVGGLRILQCIHHFLRFFSTSFQIESNSAA